MKRFIKDIKKYYKYTIFAAKSTLKSEVSNSHLNWLWWILDPLLFMFVYMFIALIVFGKGEKYFPIFVFIGLTIWNFFNKTVTKSTKVIKTNRSIVSKVYIPKYILILQIEIVNAFKMIISFSIVLVMMVFFRVPVTFNIVWIIPLLLLLLLGTFALSTIVAHFGVFIDDLNNVMTILLKLWFYMSGIFYSITDRVPAPYNMILEKVNPVGFVISQMRRCMIYESGVNVTVLLVWFIISLLIAIIGINTIYKYENTYVKVI